jgi:hypothetical protein
VTVFTVGGGKVANEAIEKLKAQYAKADLDAETEPEVDDAGADDDLDDDFGGETDPESGDDDGGEGSEPEETGTDPQKRGSDEEASLLNGEKTVKLDNGEWISKKSFLKRLKGEAEKRKTYEERIKKYDEKKDYYGRWEQYSQQFEEAARFTNQLQPIFQREPWLAHFVSEAIAGKPTNWQALAINLKPMLAPFWDGAPEVVKPDPASLASQQVREVQKQLEEFKTAQQKQQEQIQSRETQQRHQTTFAQMEQQVWKRWPNHQQNNYLRDQIYDKAERIQSLLPPGQIVDLNKVAAEIIGLYEADRKSLATRAQGSRNRARRAGGERGSGLPGNPIPADPTAKPKTLREQVRASVLGGLGLKAGSAIE